MRLRPYTDFEVNVAIRLAKQDYARDQIDSAELDFQIDAALNAFGTTHAFGSKYLPMVDTPVMERIRA